MLIRSTGYDNVTSSVEKRDLF